MPAGPDTAACSKHRSPQPLSSTRNEDADRRACEQDDVGRRYLNTSPFELVLHRHDAASSPPPPMSARSVHGEDGRPSASPEPRDAFRRLPFVGTKAYAHRFTGRMFESSRRARSSSEGPPSSLLHMPVGTPMPPSRPPSSCCAPYTLHFSGPTNHYHAATTRTRPSSAPRRDPPTVHSVQNDRPTTPTQDRPKSTEVEGKHSAKETQHHAKAQTRPQPPSASMTEPQSPSHPRPMSAPTSRRSERVVRINSKAMSTAAGDAVLPVRSPAPPSSAHRSPSALPLPMVPIVDIGSSVHATPCDDVIQALSVTSATASDGLQTPDSTTEGLLAFKGSSLAKFREIGNTAVALTRLQRIDPDFTLDVLRARGIDVNCLDKLVDRLPRFLLRVRGKLLMRRLKAQWAKPNVVQMVREMVSAPQRHRPGEHVFDIGRRSSDVVRLFRMADDVAPPSPSSPGRDTQSDRGVASGARSQDAAVPMTPHVFPEGSTMTVSDMYVAIAVPPEWRVCLLLRDIGAMEMMQGGGARLTFAAPSLAVSPLTLSGSGIAHRLGDSSVVLVLRDADVLSCLLNQFAQRQRIGTQIVRRLFRPKFDIVHFNDVYHLEAFKYPNGPGVVGGASRFLTKLREIQTHRNPLILFSGDFMSPSLQSVLMRGKHMIDAFNLIGVHFGTFGNHEFDYGMEALRDCIHGQVTGNFVFAGSNTRWIMSNMVDRDGRPLGGAVKYALTTWNGVTIGILGLSENWLPSCNQLQPHESQYLDVFAEGERLAQMLKLQGAACVVALTHSRLQTDKEMAVRCPSIDLILGGHDHFYKCLPKHRLIKSGEEFEYLTEIEVSIDEEGAVQTRTVAHPIHHGIPLDPSMETIVARYDTRVQQRMGKIIGSTTVPLDCTEACCRFKEGLLPGFFCDVMVAQTKADFAVLGGAAIAGKSIMPPGDITLGDVFNWFPGDTRVMTVRIPGSTVQKLLDVMVREVPDEAPSFPHPSASLKFTINTMRTPAVTQDIFVHGKPLDRDAMYTVAVEDFVGLGKAKYKFIPKEGEQLVDEESAEQLTYWIIEFFEPKRKKRRSSTSSHGAQDMQEESALMLSFLPESSRIGNAPGLLGSSNRNAGGLSRGLACVANTAVARNQLYRKSAAAMYHKEMEEAERSPLRSTATSLPSSLSTSDVLMVVQETSRLSQDANESLDALSSALCNAFAHLVPCDLARCYHHDAASGASTCTVQPCRLVKPTRTAVHPTYGTYNRVRRTKEIYESYHPREDPLFHRASEGHPRGDRVESLVTVPLLSLESFSSAIQLVNVAQPITLEQRTMLQLFASQVGILVHLAHQRELKERSEALQKEVLDAAMSLLGNENIQTARLFDQLAAVSKLSRRIFSARSAQVFMVDYETEEVWTVHRTMTSKKTFTDVVTRSGLRSDPLVAQAVETGLPTLQDQAAREMLVDGGALEISSTQTKLERTDVLAVPIYAPGTDDVLCVLRLADRPGNTFFTAHEEDSAISFSAFAAVAIQTSSEVEALRTGVNRSQLKLFPTHDLGRIVWKRGWGSVRSKLRVIVSNAFKTKLGQCTLEESVAEGRVPELVVEEADDDDVGEDGEL